MKHTESPTRLFDLAASNARHAAPSTLIAYALVHLGLRRGDCVALLASDPDFEMGALQAGAVLMPVEESVSAEEFLSLASVVRLRAILFADEAQARRFGRLLPQSCQPVGGWLLFSLVPAAGLTTPADLTVVGRAYPCAEQLGQIQSRISTDEVCRYEPVAGGGLRALSHKQALARL